MEGGMKAMAAEKKRLIEWDMVPHNTCSKHENMNTGIGLNS